MTTTKPVLRLMPPQRVADAEQIAPLAYKLADAARLLALSKRTVERLCNRGELEAVGRGKLRRVLYDSIVAYLNRQREEAA